MTYEQKQKSQSNQLKQKIFDYTAELVSNDMNINLYIVLIVIENIQFLGYYNNGLTKYHALGFKQFSSIVKYINLIALLQEYNINLVLVPLFFVLNIIHIILLIAGYRAYRNKVEKKNKTVQRNFHKNKIQYFINLFMIFYTTILTIPMFQTALTAFYCSTTNNPFTMIQKCYEGTELIIAILGFLNLVWLLFITFFYSMYYCNHSPFSSSFVTCSSNWFNLGKFLVKIGPMIYFMYDPTVSFSILFLIIMNALYSTYLLVFSKFLFGYYRYNFKLQKIMIGIETFTCTYSLGFILVTLFQDANNASDMILIAWIFFSFFTSLIAIQLTIIMKKNIIKVINQTDSYKLPDIMEYIIYLIYQVETNFNQNNNGYFYIMNIAKDHKKKCQDPKCYCITFFQKAQQTSYNQQKETFYLLLLALIDRIIKQNKKAYSFFILKAYILYYKMESQIKAATTISILISDKLQFSDEMLAKGLLFQLNQQYNDTRDMEIYLRFNDCLLKQQEQSLILVNLYLSYWEQLIDQNSSIPKLQNILKKIKLSKCKLEQTVNNALQIFNHNIRVLQIYKLLVKDVLNDYLGYLRSQQMFKIGLKQSKLSVVDTINKIQFRPNQDLLVINFTRNYSTHTELIGNYKVVSISSNVKQFLGFTCNELKNHSINQLIPRIYHKTHDEYVDNILNKKNSQIQSKQIRIFPLNNQGYIIECNLISKFMPCFVNGIIIVSFMQQCQKLKDQLFIMYDAKTGAIDSMSKLAELILKDGTHKKMTDVFTMADFIGDILPTWDFKNQVIRDLNRKNKSIKSIKSLNQIKYQIKNIEVIRSDGRDEKHIKVIKIKILQFCRLNTFPQFQNDKQPNNTITISNINIESRQNSKDSFLKLDTYQIKQKIKIQSNTLNSRDKKRKRTLKLLQQNEKKKTWFIQSLPPKYLRVIFIIIQIALFLIAFGLILFQFYNSNQNLNRYEQDTTLLISLNSIQSYQSDITFITSLVISNQAYTNSNMTLPYQSYVSQIQVETQLDQMSQSLNTMAIKLNEITPLIVSKVTNLQIEQSELMVFAKFLEVAGTKIYFTKKITFLQAIYQFISYTRQLIDRLSKKKQTIQKIIQSPYYFYIFANSLDVIPDQVTHIKHQLINSIIGSTNICFSIFLIIKILVAGLIVLSASIIIFFHRYIYNSYILRVLMMYESINLEKIRVYEQKCNNFKKSLKFTNEKQKELKNLQKNDTLPQNEQTLSKPNNSNMVEEQEESKQLLNDANIKNTDEQKLQHFITFQQKPKLSNVLLQKIIWILIYGIFLTILIYSYHSQTIILKNEIVTLNNYTQAQNSLIQIRLYTHLSMNMLNYWDSSYLSIIYSQLQMKFNLCLELMNTTNLNFTAYKPYISAKYHQFKRVQLFIATNNTIKLKQLTKTIQASLQDMDDLLDYLQNQCLNYLKVVQNYSQSVSNFINAYIILNFVFVIFYWFFGVKKSYHKLLQEYSITFQMYNIIGQTLRQEVQSIK